jgi:hypothetical protein
MYSLIQNASELGLTYNASSLTIYSSINKPENVFTNSFFHSGHSPSDQWWQVSFSKPVEISSYIIQTVYNHGIRPKRWYAMSSFDGVLWRIVGVYDKDTGGNTERFYPYEPFNCFHFKIVLIQNTNNDNYLAFTFFDCFGKLGTNQTKRYMYYCNTLNTHNSLTMQILFSSLISLSH